jgi:hypothetical protein
MEVDCLDEIRNTDGRTKAMMDTSKRRGDDTNDKCRERDETTVWNENTTVQSRSGDKRQ